jgi:hypothetical protein
MNHKKNRCAQRREEAAGRQSSLKHGSPPNALNLVLNAKQLSLSPRQVFAKWLPER